MIDQKITFCSASDRSKNCDTKISCKFNGCLPNSACRRVDKDSLTLFKLCDIDKRMVCRSEYYRDRGSNIERKRRRNATNRVLINRDIACIGGTSPTTNSITDLEIMFCIWADLGHDSSELTHHS